MFSILQKIFIISCAIACLTEATSKRQFLSVKKYTKGSHSKFFDLCSQFNFFTQNVDHFGFNQVDTYQQRYIISDKYWQGAGSPIFFYTGNEGDIQWFCENTGFVWEQAEQLGALVVFAEHRYYGNSMPYGAESYSKANLNYLTSEQALADYAYLIKSIKSSRPETQKSAVIAFGGSYGGMLAAWFRMKYPNIVTGALAASAPIFQFVAECNSMNQVITNAFEKADALCPHLISQSWNVMNKMSETPQGLQSLTEIFKLCKPLTKSTDLKAYISDIYGNIAMANYPYPSKFLSDLPAWPVKVMCEKIVQSIDKNFHRDNIKLMTAIYQGINVYSNYTGQLVCNSIDSDIPGIQMESWNYQTCTEFVFPTCSDGGKTDMFEFEEWNNATYSEACLGEFSVKPKSEWPIFNYGASLNDLRYHSNIVFSNGDLDPWYSGGVIETINERLPAIVIKDGAHHLDLRSSNKDDTEAVRQARLLEIKYIKQWIQENDSTA